MVTMDIPPFMMIAGTPAQCRGLNLVGLKRRDFSQDHIQILKKVYKVFYREGLSVQDACKKIEAWIGELPLLQKFIDFVTLSERGVLR